MFPIKWLKRYVTLLRRIKTLYAWNTLNCNFKSNLANALFILKSLRNIFNLKIGSQLKYCNLRKIYIYFFLFFLWITVTKYTYSLCIIWPRYNPQGNFLQLCRSCSLPHLYFHKYLIFLTFHFQSDLPTCAQTGLLVPIGTVTFHPLLIVQTRFSHLFISTA